MLCEMCGKDVASTARARIERSVLSLCPECARFGQLLDPPPTPAVNLGAAPASSRSPLVGATRAGGRGRRLEERDLYTDIGEMELAPDWFKRIRVAREAHAWTPEDFGKKLNEKKSVVLKIESGGFRPPDALVRKIELQLKVRLRADPEPSSSP